MEFIGGLRITAVQREAATAEGHRAEHARRNRHAGRHRPDRLRDRPAPRSVADQRTAREARPLAGVDRSARPADRSEPAQLRHGAPARSPRTGPSRAWPVHARRQELWPRADLPDGHRLRAGPLGGRGDRGRSRSSRSRRTRSARDGRLRHRPGRRCGCRQRLLWHSARSVVDGGDGDGGCGAFSGRRMRAEVLRQPGSSTCGRAEHSLLRLTWQVRARYRSSPRSARRRPSRGPRRTTCRRCWPRRWPGTSACRRRRSLRPSRWPSSCRPCSGPMPGAPSTTGAAVRCWPAPTSCSRSVSSRWPTRKTPPVCLRRGSSWASAWAAACTRPLSPRWCGCTAMVRAMPSPASR